jgi:chaperonin GroES
LQGQEIIIIGDRVLIKPNDEENRKTKSGLYLPQGVAAKEETLSGIVAKVGPGIPMAAADDEEAPWLHSEKTKYIPMQVEIGDLAIFLARFAHKIEYEEETYYIVPQAGILMLIRENDLS